ncbi:MAG: hypothetical protein ACRCTD_03785 [Beijerinckiaceae bacterium]
MGLGFAALAAAGGFLFLSSAAPVLAQAPRQPAAAANSADNAAVAIKDVRVQFYLEKSATFSDNIASAGKPFMNAARGEGIAEPASGLLVTLEVNGPKGGKSSDKIASHIAQIIVTRKYRTGPKSEQKVFGGFRFNEQGVAYKAFMLDAATCAPLDVDVRLGRSRKRISVDFDCTPEG